MKTYFAWIDGSDQFDANIHGREDEKIFHLEIGQNEAAFARARVTIQNPRHGLLWPPHKQHCFISFQQELIFKGRLLSMPSQIEGELVTLEFIAMGKDVDHQRQTLCKEMKDNGVYDRLFYTTEPELKDLLQAYTALPHWDRLTSQLSLSDIFKGRKHLDLDGRFFRDSLKVAIAQEPLSAVNVELKAEWLQQARGACEISHHLKKACPSGYLSSLTAESLEKAWWSKNTPLQKNGYHVVESQLKPIKPLDKATYPSASNPFWHWDEKPKQVQFPRQWYDLYLRLGWSYRQKRREVASFTLKHNVQDMNGGSQRVKTLSFSLASILGRNHLWQPDHVYTKGFQVLHEDAVYKCIKRHQSGDSFKPSKWLKQENHVHVDGQAARASFFPTERGQQAISYALEIAKAHIAASARCITVSVAARLEDLMNITLDHNLTIRDSRLPGGAVKGKVIGYRFLLNGKTGERIAEVKLGVSVGTGIQVTAAFPEDQPYVEADVWEETVSSLNGIHHRSPSAICFRMTGDQPPPMGIHRPSVMYERDLVEGVEILNDGEQQNRRLAQQQYPRGLDLKAVLKEMPTNISIKLKDLKTYGCLDHQVQVDVLTAWSAPKQIDLSASTNT